MTAQSLQIALAPLPGGTSAVYYPSVTFYAHSDWLGSTRLLSSTGRGIQTTMAYAPFGEGYAGGSPTFVTFTSDGYAPLVDPGQNDNGTLDDFVFRHYSPGQGRWISPDPAGVAAVSPTNPQTWNRYAYVANNPLSYIDPTGLFCVWDDGSYDSSDDPETGTADSCASAGGNWFDGSPSGWSLNADWSSQANANFANQWLNQQPQYTFQTQANASLPSDSSWLGILLNSPLTVSWILPIYPVPFLGGVGPAGSVAWNPKTKNICLSIGIGVSAGHNVAAGPIVGMTLSGQQASPSEIDQILTGWSANFGGNVPIGPVPAGPGGQVSVNGSGAVYGPTGGAAGFSVSATGAGCAHY
jgi:RHS repeat-associated protein